MEVLIVLVVLVAFAGFVLYRNGLISLKSMDEIVPVDDAGNPPANPTPDVDLASFKKADLVALAKEKGVKVTTKMTKDQIIAELK